MKGHNSRQKNNRQSIKLCSVHKAKVIVNGEIPVETTFHRAENKDETHTITLIKKIVLI